MKAAIWLQQWFGLLLTGVVAVGILPLILPSQVTQITPEVEAEEFENKAVLLVNSLLSNSHLIYSDNRGIFDEQKLNTAMVEKSGNFDNILACLSLCTFNSYQDSFSIVLVKDAEASQGWFSILWPVSSTLHEKINSCLSDVDKDDVQRLFDDKADIPGILGIQKCGFQRNSKITSVGFPLAIRMANGDTHIGWIKVMVVE